MNIHFDYPDGATPIHDASELLLPWVQTMSDLNRVEAENIAEAQRKYLRFGSQDCSSWLHFKEMQSIHRMMFGRVWGWAGKIRRNKTSIGVNPGFIHMRLAEFYKEVASWSIEPVELTFLEKSAKIHHQLVSIHPFENGNGRFSRLVADRALLCWKLPHPIWPDDLHRDGSDRKKYIQTLKDADKGDYGPLISLMKEFGSSDPPLQTMLQDNFYSAYFDGPKGVAMIRALIKTNKNDTFSIHSVMKSKLNQQTKLNLIKELG